MDSHEQSGKPTEERSTRSKFNRRWVKITAGVVTAGVLLVLGVTAEAVTPSPGHKRPPPTATATATPTPKSSATSAPTTTPTPTPTPASSSGASQVGIADPDLIGESATVQASNLAGMKAIGKTVREGERAEKTTAEMGYYLVCRALTTAPSNEVARQQWDVENYPHWRLDLLRNEDQDRTRMCHELENLAALRKSRNLCNSIERWKQFASG